MAAASADAAVASALASTIPGNYPSAPSPARAGRREGTVPNHVAARHHSCHRPACCSGLQCCCWSWPRCVTSPPAIVPNGIPLALAVVGVADSALQGRLLRRVIAGRAGLRFRLPLLADALDRRRRRETAGRRGHSGATDRRRELRARHRGRRRAARARLSAGPAPRSPRRPRPAPPPAAAACSPAPGAPSAGVSIAAARCPYACAIACGTLLMLR